MPEVVTATVQMHPAFFAPTATAIRRQLAPADLSTPVHVVKINFRPRFGSGIELLPKKVRTMGNIASIQKGHSETFDVLCFSHLRWDFVYQRPQHLLSRFARDHRVYFIEETVYGDGVAEFEMSKRENGLHVVVPKLSHGMSPAEEAAELRRLLDGLIEDQQINEYISWYYTPQMLPWSRHLDPLASVFDCMDELSAFKNAPAELKQREADLLEYVDVVFTGGHSLYEAKKTRHPNVHAFPSSIEREHFARARDIAHEPDDQARIPQPKLGFFGVIDERFDIGLLDRLAGIRPEWNFVMIGPVVKISEEELPRRDNIHYLGSKSYAELPEYLAGWDVALMPFAINESTKFISPTKTPEYLAAGKPVISTAIRDVVNPYGNEGLVEIASTAEAFAKAAERILSGSRPEEWQQKVDAFLSRGSWDKTWERMLQLVEDAIQRNSKALTQAA